MFLKDESNSQIAPSGIFLQKYTVSCANPLWGAAEFAAFCGDFGLTAADDTQIEFRRRNVEGGGRAQELNHQTYRGGIGVKGAVNDAWSYDASLFQGTSRISNTYNNDFSTMSYTNGLPIFPSIGVEYIP